MSGYIRMLLHAGGKKMKTLLLALVSLMLVVSSASAISGSADSGSTYASITDSNGGTATSASVATDVTYNNWQTFATLTPGGVATSTNQGGMATTTGLEATTQGVGIDGDKVIAQIAIADLKDQDATGSILVSGQTTLVPTGTVTASQALSASIDDGLVQASVKADEGLHNVAFQAAQTGDFDNAGTDFGSMTTQQTASADISGSNGGGYVTATQTTTMNADAATAVAWGTSESSAFHAGDKTAAEIALIDLAASANSGGSLTVTGNSAANDHGSSVTQVWTVSGDQASTLANAYVGALHATAGGSWTNPSSLSATTYATQDLTTPYAGVL